jgi:tRNA/tmRNA/rRNA uracil-C5-methylase (TrmA/RlmC/RlmD family)
VATPTEPALLELDVGTVAAGGCVARAPDGRVVFVRHCLPGERVQARITATTTSYLRADAVEILVPSPDRVVPPCPHAGPGRCGGCDFQHVTLAAQRRLKASLVTDQLSRLAGIDEAVEVHAVAGDRDGLAWRTRVRVGVDRRGVVGFRRHRSHRLEHVRQCPVAADGVAATGALGASWPGVAQLEVVTGDAGEALVEVTPRVHGTPHLPEVDAGLVVRGRVRRPPGAVHHTVGSRTYRVSAGVFWQVHRGAPEALQRAVLALVGDCSGEEIVDLYAGAGLFSVALAEAAGPHGSVLAVERDGRACEDARHNGIGMRALRVLQAAVTPELVTSGIGRPTVLVLDPARAGAGTGVMRALATHAHTLHTLVYVSCDSATFGRDARVLLDAGWRLSALRALDIFPMTEHVELVAALTPAAGSG